MAQILNKGFNIAPQAIVRVERITVNPIESIVAKMRSDLEAVGGFENELLGVPAGGVRGYIEKLEAALKEMETATQPTGRKD